MCAVLGYYTAYSGNSVPTFGKNILVTSYRGAGKSLAQPTSRCIMFDGENISFDASLVIYINSTNIPPIMIINRIYKNQNLLSLYLVSFLVGLRSYQHPCKRSSPRLLDPRRWEPIGCPERSVRSYHSTLRKSQNSGYLIYVAAEV
jgi:hypothetical protein